MPTIPTANFRSPVSLACFLLVAAVGLVIDLWTKYLAWSTLVADTVRDEMGRQLVIGDATPVIKNWLNFTAVANYGAAMGIGQGRRAIFVVVSVLAVAVLFYFFALSGRRRLYQVTLGLLLAGVIGNLYDRLVFGYVRDMIHVFPGYRWSDLHESLPNVGLFPWVFNVADMFLCVGVTVVLLYGVFASEDERSKSADTAEADAGQPATETGA